MGLVAVVIVFTVFVFTPSRFASVQRGQLSFAFIGFYTNTSGQTLARFSVSNEFPWELVYRLGVPQIKSNGIWPSDVITPGVGTYILPREATNFLVAPPGSTGVWRVPVISSRHVGRGERMIIMTRIKLASVLGQPTPDLWPTSRISHTTEVRK